eukprot:994876-Prymnesium_polylepis.1
MTVDTNTVNRLNESSKRERAGRGGAESLFVIVIYKGQAGGGCGGNSTTGTPQRLLQAGCCLSRCLR